MAASPPHKHNLLPKTFFNHQTKSGDSEEERDELAIELPIFYESRFYP